MAYFQIEKLLKKTKSLYKTVILAAKRTIELSEGAEKLIETNLKDPGDIALKEIEEGKVFVIEKDNKKG